MRGDGNVLVGKTLTGMKLAEDRLAILFQTTDGDILVRVDADCFSYTWVESIELPALGFPALVTVVEDLEMPDVGDNSKYHDHPEVLEFYGCKITTDRGGDRHRLSERFQRLLRRIAVMAGRARILLWRCSWAESCLQMNVARHRKLDTLRTGRTL